MARPPESLGASGGSAALVPAFASYWLRKHVVDRIAVFGDPWPNASGCEAVPMTRRNG
jgi:hypothetical protein